MTISSDSKITLISENWGINLILLFFKVFVMRAGQYESCKLFMIGQKIKHNLLIFLGIACLVISQRFILEKFQLFDRIEVIAWFVNENFFIIFDVFWILWFSTQISVNKEIVEWTFDNFVRNDCWYFFERVESVDNMEQPYFTNIKQLSNAWFSQFDQHFCYSSENWITK